MPMRARPGGVIKTLLSILLLTLLLTAAAASVGLTMFLKEVSADLPTTEEILSKQPSQATSILDRNGKLIAKLFQEDRTIVPLEKVSPWFIKSVLAAEDSDFYEHQGVSPTAILRAVLVDLIHRGARQGGSTITQQLSRNMFLSHEKRLSRKIKEAVLSLRLERVYTKDQILEMYVNTIYMGHGTYGIGSASQFYFGKSPSDLTLAEASTLAGLIAAPEYYSPIKNPTASKTRQRYVLGRMLELGWITAEQHREALSDHLSLKGKARRSRISSEAPYFVAYILFKNLLPTYGTDRVYRGGLTVHTTLDLDVQRAAERAFSKLKYEGALVALDPDTGEILAMVGGHDFERSKFNRVVQAFRQPGSAFKPIVYAAALESGYRGVDHLLDAPLNFPNGWSPKNYDGGYDGEVSMVDAVVRSLNTPVVRLAQIIGVKSVIDTARSMGITSPHLPNDLSIALGSTSVTPLEMAASFATFANGGYRISPFAIREVRTPAGDVLERNGPQLERGISPETAIEMRTLLEQVTIFGTGRPAAVPGYQTFGKTGTTNDWGDAWFVGGIPGLVAVVYAGNDDHRSLGAKATGGRIAAPVWRDFIEGVLKVRKLPQRFQIPSDVNVEFVRVCVKTGFLTAPGCKGAYIALKSGEAPTAQCPLHGGGVAAARSDPNGPQLILSPMDDDTTVGRYAMRYGAAQEQPRQGTSTEAPASPLSKPQKPAAAPPAPAPNPSFNPYRADPSPSNEVEKKYQQLLKKYNIDD
ncbi:transglycosylase domain-containing protein [Thermanaerovibrio acidaminovorans]|uniref:transglycosylase domain-containing protein n=1 Tax=Thermanaerovibrio acidaminovorans TaxID=81462 RepID=UPI003A52326B